MVSSNAQARSLATRLQNYLRQNALRHRDHERIGPFVCTFHTNDNPFLNYAIPDDEAFVRSHDVEALAESFRKRIRLPRLEFFPDATPSLESILLEHGFLAERRLPIMTADAGPANTIAMPEGIELTIARHRSDFINTATALAEAYGGEGAGAEGLYWTTRGGGVVMTARETTTGLIAGGGIASAPIDGVSEIASIGVRPAFRERGIAAAIAHELQREFFARGGLLAWLTPEHEHTARVYTRAGYKNSCEVLHIRQEARS